MTAHDLYLLAPELALAGVAGIVVFLDLLVRRKGVVAVVALLGLLVPIALAIILWGDVQGESAVFGTLVVDKFASSSSSWCWLLSPC